jgi:DNA-binding protein H-NS
MKKSFLQIQRQIEQLERQAEALKKAEVADVVKRIKDAIQVYGLTASDLGLAAPARKAAGGRASAPAGRKAGKKLGKVAPKFRDDAGNTWTGRGNQPRWLRAALDAGRKLDEFKI